MKNTKQWVRAVCLILAALMLLSLLVIEMDWRPLLGKRNGMK